MLQRRVSPAKKYLRRTLQVVALVGTLLIGIVALALIVSQTPWFRDWLRSYVVRQAGQYLNGTVSIGSLGGNLFYGVQLGDVAIDVNGEHIMTLKNVEVKYSIGELVSQGVTVREIKLEQPFVLLRHDRERLEHRQPGEAAEAGSESPGAGQAGVAAGHRDRGRPRGHRGQGAVPLLPAAVADRRAQREGGVRVRARALQPDAR